MEISGSSPSDQTPLRWNFSKKRSFFGRKCIKKILTPSVLVGSKSYCRPRVGKEELYKPTSGFILIGAKLTELEFFLCETKKKNRPPGEELKKKFDKFERP
jgi:hypothetical protein